ncbi:MAG: GDP-mannose 4,6-dehydratase [Thermoanaerobaculia bacterium]
MNASAAGPPVTPAVRPLAGRTVLVTGAGGFIASHLIERLVAEGAVVRAFRRYNSRADLGCLGLIPAETRRRVDVVFGDLQDEGAVREAMHDREIIFHLGALTAVPYSYLHPRHVVETNVLGTLNVLMAAKTLRPGRLIHTSSSEVYGTAMRVPIDEQHLLRGQSPYAASKIGAEALVESFVRSFDLPAVTLRPFNTYGPRQSDRAIIPAVISQALASGELVLGNLEPERDFLFVTDTVDGFLRAAVADDLAGETINLGSGSAVTIAELVRTVARLLDRPLTVRTDPSRVRPARSEVGKLLADGRKARALLGWEPRVSFEDGLRRTIDWVRRNPGYFTPDRYAL